jgi:DNA-binding transcriptional MocR family regulator
MNEAWNPAIADKHGTLHDRLIRALRQDIETGQLVADGKLPPHRMLARRLGVGIGTVTRAYSEAEQLGLVTSSVGRGTFVLTPSTPTAPDDDRVIDLSLNVQSLTTVTAKFSDALTRLQRRSDLFDCVNYSPHVGIDWHRQALADWLRANSNFARADWKRLAITTGSQHAMALAVDELCKPGDVILTEAATFAGFMSITNYRGVTCEGIAMDGEGMIPAAMEEAVARFRSRVVYLQPTLHNPTTRTMSLRRRKAIVEIARRLDLTIIEDDVYAPIAFASDQTSRDIVPLATLAPERTWYVTSVSKALAPGLRVGMMITPDATDFDRLSVAIRANCYAAGTLAPLVVAQWIKDGVADQLLASVASEARARQAIARRYLGDAIEQPSCDTSLHVWLPMSELQAERFANTALRRGVMLTPPGSLLVNGAEVSGVRMCLNTVPRPQLERALRIVRSVLADEIVPSQNSIV